MYIKTFLNEPPKAWIGKFMEVVGLQIFIDKL